MKFISVHPPCRFAIRGRGDSRYWHTRRNAATIDKIRRYRAMSRVFFPLLPLAAVALGSCTSVPTAATDPEPPAQGVPSGAVADAMGFWSIGEVPSSPFPTLVPEDPTIGTEDEIARFARENGLTAEQAMAQINGPVELRTEYARIAEAVRAEPYFVSSRLVRDPAVRIEMWFTRDAAATLARHTRNPLIVARDGGWTMAEQERRQALWVSRMEEGRISTLAADGIGRKIELGVGIPEQQFLTIARGKGWDLSGVEARYSDPQPAAFAEPSMASHINAFAREETDPQMRMSALGIGRIVLDGGCFRQRATGDEPSRLVMFGYGTTLDRDADGYLVVRSPGNTVYRIGEIGGWNAPNFVDEGSADVKALRAACGSDPIVNVGYPSSYRLFGLPDPTWVTDYAKVRKLSRQTAWDEIVACIGREEKRGRIGLDARDRCVTQFSQP